MDSPRYDLSPADAAHILGVHVGTLKRWANDGRIGAFKTPGGHWKFRRSDLDAFLVAGTVNPDAGSVAS